MANVLGKKRKAQLSLLHKKATRKGTYLKQRYGVSFKPKEERKYEFGSVKEYNAYIRELKAELSSEKYKASVKTESGLKIPQAVFEQAESLQKQYEGWSSEEFEKIKGLMKPTLERRWGDEASDKDIQKVMGSFTEFAGMQAPDLEAIESVDKLKKQMGRLRERAEPTYLEDKNINLQDNTKVAIERYLGMYSGYERLLDIVDSFTPNDFVRLPMKYEEWTIRVIYFGIEQNINIMISQAASVTAELEAEKLEEQAQTEEMGVDVEKNA